MSTTYEHGQDHLEPERLPVDEIGDFATESWRAWEAGELTDEQALDRAQTLAFRLNLFADNNDIKPPEAAILELTEDAETAALDLIETGLQADESSLQALLPGALDGMKRILDQGRPAEIVVERLAEPSITADMPLADICDLVTSAWEACDIGALTDNQVVNKVRGFIGRLCRYASEQEIKPPELAIAKLTPDAIQAARDLMEAALSANLQLKKKHRMHDHTVQRIKRFLAQTLEPISDLIPDPAEVSPTMSLKEVARTLGADDLVGNYRQALRHAKDHLG